MSQLPIRLMRPGFVHAHMGLKDHEFFAHIDSSGGWPVGYRYVGFEHTDERRAGFTNSKYSDGWWTVLYTADDYYLWKLSPECLQRIVDATREAIRLPEINASKLRVRNSSGYIAALGVQA